MIENLRGKPINELWVSNIQTQYKKKILLIATHTIWKCTFRSFLPEMIFKSHIFTVKNTDLNVA